MRLFGTSGVRGVVGAELRPDMALRLGQALAVRCRGGTVALARDSRLTGPMLESAIAAGLLSGGVDVMRIGLMPTPALAYITRARRCKAGVMVTASHNPPEYNGIKFFNEDGIAFTDSQEHDIESLYSAEAIPLAGWDGIGRAFEEDAADLYIDGVIEKLRFRRKWKAILDLGGGASCRTAPSLFHRLGFDLRAINDREDGRFSARSPEPSEGSLEALSQLVVAIGADVGIAFDGDADRFGLVDSSGKYVQPDSALAAYAGSLSRKEKCVIVVPVDTSMAVEEVVRRNGGTVVYCKVGDVDVAEKVKAHGARFGGETSGAWINPDFHLCPDGMLSSLLFMAAVEEARGTVADFVKKVPTYPVKRAKVSCPNERKEAAMKLLGEKAAEMAGPALDVNALDGLKVMLREGWFLIRPSGTEPALRVTVESKDEGTATRLLEDLSLKVGQVVRRAGS